MITTSAILVKSIENLFEARTILDDCSYISCLVDVDRKVNAKFRNKYFKKLTMEVAYIFLLTGHIEVF